MSHFKMPLTHSYLSAPPAWVRQGGSEISRRRQTYLFGGNSVREAGLLTSQSFVRDTDLEWVEVDLSYGSDGSLLYWDHPTWPVFTFNVSHYQVGLKQMLLWINKVIFWRFGMKHVGEFEGIKRVKLQEDESTQHSSAQWIVEMLISWMKVKLEEYKYNNEYACVGISWTYYALWNGPWDWAERGGFHTHFWCY